MGFNLSFDDLAGKSALLIGMATSDGYSIHKSYLIRLSKLNLSDLNYTSKFPIPPGTKISIILTNHEHELRVHSIVTSNSQTVNRLYTVFCDNLSLIWNAQDTKYECHVNYFDLTKESSKHLN